MRRRKHHARDARRVDVGSACVDIGPSPKTKVLVFLILCVCSVTDFSWSIGVCVCVCVCLSVSLSFCRSWARSVPSWARSWTMQKWLNRSICSLQTDSCGPLWDEGRGRTKPFAAASPDKMAIRPFVRIFFDQLWLFSPRGMHAPRACVNFFLPFNIHLSKENSGSNDRFLPNFTI